MSEEQTQGAVTQEPVNAEGEALLDQIAAEMEASQNQAQEQEAAPEEQSQESAGEESQEREPKATGKPDKPQKASQEEKEELVSPKLAKIARAQKRALKRIEEKEAELEKKLAQFKQQETGIGSLDELKALARKNPVKFYRDVLGIEKTADVGRMLYAEELGEHAPEDLKRLRDRWGVEQELSNVRKQFEEFRQQIEQERAKQSEQAVWSESRSALRDYVRELDGEATPYLKRLADTRPDQVVEALLETAVLYARENPDADPLTADDLVEKYEEALAEELSPFGISFEEKTEKPATKRKAGKTLTNKLATPTGRNEPKSEEELIADIAADLMAGRAE